jgi:hypothetical protein
MLPVFAEISYNFIQNCDIEHICNIFIYKYVLPFGICHWSWNIPYWQVQCRYALFYLLQIRLNSILAAAPSFGIPFKYHIKPVEKKWCIYLCRNRTLKIRKFIGVITEIFAWYQPLHCFIRIFRGCCHCYYIALQKKDAEMKLHQSDNRRRAFIAWLGLHLREGNFKKCFSL